MNATDVAHDINSKLSRFVQELEGEGRINPGAFSIVFNLRSQPDFDSQRAHIHLVTGDTASLGPVRHSAADIDSPEGYTVTVCEDGSARAAKRTFGFPDSLESGSYKNLARSESPADVDNMLDAVRTFVRSRLPSP